MSISEKKGSDIEVLPFSDGENVVSGEGFLIFEIHSTPINMGFDYTYVNI